MRRLGTFMIWSPVKNWRLRVWILEPMGGDWVWFGLPGEPLGVVLDLISVPR